MCGPGFIAFCSFFIVNFLTVWSKILDLCDVFLTGPLAAAVTTRRASSSFYSNICKFFFSLQPQNQSAACDLRPHLSRHKPGVSSLRLRSFLNVIREISSLICSERAASGSRELSECLFLTRPISEVIQHSSS